MIWVNLEKERGPDHFQLLAVRTRQPSLSDLMPLTDNSNPLYITRGNPDLKQMFSHSVRVSFQHSKKRYICEYRRADGTEQCDAGSAI